MEWGITGVCELAVTVAAFITAISKMPYMGLTTIRAF
jgi:hypothetical protein